MHLHILGICGTFMGGLAKIAAERGYSVTGCDAHVYPPMSDQLRALGIELHEGYDAAQVDRVKADLYVVGNAMTRGMPVVEAILDRGLPYASGPQWLAENVLPDKWVLAVAGTHGKSTTSSMLAWLLEANGLAPGLPHRRHPAQLRRFRAPGRIALLRDRGRRIRHGVLRQAFEVRVVPPAHRGARKPRVRPRRHLPGPRRHRDAVPSPRAHRALAGPDRLNGQDAALERVLARGAWTQIERFGTGQSWSVGTVHPDDSFDVLLEGAKQGTVRWPLMGEHNRMNALAALAAARHVGILPKAAIESLARFEGVKRRMEIRGEIHGITVYDDFAHHPTAFETTIAGLRTRVGDARIVAVFEPRSNTMKLGRMQERLAKSLGEADLVHCYANALGWDPGQALAPLGTRATVHHQLEALVDELAAVLRPGDHVLIMSNGGFGSIHEKLIARLARRPASTIPGFRP